PRGGWLSGNEYYTRRVVDARHPAGALFLFARGRGAKRHYLPSSLVAALLARQSRQRRAPGFAHGCGTMLRRATPVPGPSLPPSDVGPIRTKERAWGLPSCLTIPFSACTEQARSASRHRWTCPTRKALRWP